MISLDGYNTCKPCKPRKKNEDLKIYNHDGCAVCLEDDQDTMLLPCAHSFHGDCILPWVKQNFSCPMCRSQIGQFVPLKGTIKDEFTELWNQHYLEAPATPKQEPVQDELKKQPVQVELTVDLDEYELLLDASKFVEEKIEPEEKNAEEKLEEQMSGFVHTTTDTSELTDALIRASANSMISPRDILRRKLFTVRNIMVEENTVEPKKSKPMYETIDNLRAGACSGVLTTLGRMLVEKQPVRNFYPVLREVGPNVAIYFTTYEHTKKCLGRKSDSYLDIWHQCFVSGCVGGLFAYLPRTHFTPLVPLQFGIHFSVFEVAKQAITNQTGRERLTVADVGSTAILGGIIGSCITFPLSQMYGNLQVALEGQAISLTHNLRSKFASHVLKMSPLWATTACGFEFSRRLITNT